MSQITYPPKPWKNGQTSFLLPNMQFIYRSSLKKWVPFTPNSSLNDNTETSNSELLDVLEKLFSLQNNVENLRKNISENGSIFKNIKRPQNPKNNDIWIDEDSGRTLHYNSDLDVWVEVTK